MSRRDFPNTRDFLIKVHNIHVKRAIKELTANKNAVAKDKINKLLQTALLTKNDTAQQILLKQFLFWFDLGHLSKRIEPIATLPDSWQIKKLRQTPQLVVVYRKIKKTRSGNYGLVIPHYDGTRNPKAINYQRGNKTGILVLKDNSKLVVNASTDTEAERVVKHFRKYINPKYLTDDFRITKRGGKTIATDDYRPIRADYYPDGQSDNLPKWKHYY